MGARFIAEERIVGPAALYVPLLLGGMYLAGIGALHAGAGMRAVCLFASWLWIQGLLPLLVGFLAAGLGAREAAGELPFTWPVPYGRVALVRFACVTGGGVISAVMCFVVADLQHLWPVAAPFAAPPAVMALVECAGCLLTLWGCAAVGWGSAVLLRSTAASRILIALLAGAGLMAFAGSGGVRAWVTLYGAWMVLGAAVLGGGWWRIREPEWTLGRMEEQP